MGVETDVDISNRLQSPTDDFEVEVHDQSFPTEPFDRDEAQLFEVQLNQLIAHLDSSMFLEVLQQRAQTIADVAAFAKHDLEAKNFGGINAGDNEIGFSILRPGHIRADPATGAAENDWYFTPGATGWVDWIGDGAGNNKVVDEDEVLLVLAFTDQEDAATEISGINVDEFGRNMDMLPQDLNDARLFDNDNEQQVVSLPTLIGQENDDVHIRLRADRDVERQPRLFGFTFALGTRLNVEDY